MSKNIPLLLDKNPNVRQMASRALGTMYGIDPNSVSSQKNGQVQTLSAA